jgi:peptidoglycan/LPS O-acetylase OafA/YrhL
VQRSSAVTAVDLLSGEEPEAPEPPDDPVVGPGGDAPTVAPRPQVAGLDGIRAVAVLGVLAFHAGLSRVTGGLLGVDIFFVLSGFLITSLLVGEWSSSGSIGFRRFYERRARRLLPALFLTMLLVAAYAHWFALPSTLEGLRGDALSTLAYVANWHFIVTGQNYFIRFGPPSPLLHTWSLAVEEQFYVVWPALALFVLRRRGRRGLAVVAAVGMVLSATATAVLYHHGASVTRLYYGTDTRVQEVMAGALLAVVLPRLARRVRDAEVGGATGLASPGRVVSVIGTVGGLCLLWALFGVSGGSSFLYSGGFLLVGTATAAVILLVMVRPGAVATRVLGLSVLGYIGRISYGLYLYHYPLFQMIDGPHTGLSGPALLSARLAATFAAAVVSYHLVEMPVRNRRALPGWHLAVAIPVGLAIVITALFVTTVPPPPQVVPKTPTKTGVFAVPAIRPPGLPPGHNVRVLLLGDSLALTLGPGLGVQSGAWGATLINQGIVGCDLDPSSVVDIEGSVTVAAQGCAHWPEVWQGQVDRLNPDVVTLELGRWDVSNRIVDGTWTRIGEPAWDHLYASELSSAIRILSSRGAHVVVFTLPYVTQTTDAPDGTPWDINQPVRTDQYNALVRKTVGLFPRVASVIDLNHLLDPKGVYTTFIDGVPVRSDDQEHISLYGGMFLRPAVLPTLVQLGLAHERARTAPSATTTTGSAAQAGTVTTG